MTPNMWFREDICSEGDARLELGEPKAVIEGRAKVRLDERGWPEIDITIVRADPAVFKTGRLMAFCGQLGNVRVRSSLNGLTVDTPEGKFWTEGGVWCHGAVFGSPVVVTCESFQVWFAARNAGASEFWVAPLVNFLADFPDQDPKLDSHPLRVRSRSHARTTVDAAGQGRSMIAFSSGEELAFIEPLPDYDERAKQLRSGIRNGSLLRSWLGALGAVLRILLSPSKVGSRLAWTCCWSLPVASPPGLAWIEFRDQQGGLVGRLNWARSRARGVKGTPHSVGSRAGSLGNSSPRVFDPESLERHTFEYYCSTCYASTCRVRSTIS